MKLRRKRVVQESGVRRHKANHYKTDYPRENIVIEMEKEPKKKSILKIGNEKKVKKSLSFASAQETTDSPIVGTRRSISEIVPTNLKDKLKVLEVTPQKKQEQKFVGSRVLAESQTYADIDNQSDFIEITAPICKSIKRTPMGLCYVPKKISGLPKTKYQETIPMKNNKRNNIVAVLKSISAAGPTANVLIIGDKILGEKIKTNLLNLSLRLTPKSLGWNIVLNIMCENSPSLDMMPDVSFFIFLINLDKLGSLVDLSNDLSKINNVGIPSHCKLVLSASFGQGVRKNIVDINEYENFLDDHQLTHFAWQEQGGPYDQQVIKLLTLIYNSVGYYRGSSLLMKYVMQRGIKEYPDDDTMF